MGWWESDVKQHQQLYFCSDFIVDLLGLESHRISFQEFHPTQDTLKITARVSETNLFSHSQILKLYEQMFPIQAKNGEIWVYSKISFRKPDKEGYRDIFGYLQYVDKPAEKQMRKHRLLSCKQSALSAKHISYSLLAFLQSDNIAEIINQILGDLLKQFGGDRT